MLTERLRSAGLADEEIRRAAEEERLATLVVELALGSVERHSLTHVARESGLGADFLRELMQAVGRPNPAPRERVYTDEDIEFARVVQRFLEAGLPREGILEVGRVTSMGMASAAGAVQRLAGEALLRPGDTEAAVGLRYATAADTLVPLMGRQLEYHFRSHLRDGIRRQLLTEAEREEGRLTGTEEVAIAFADLVDYTKLGGSLAPEDVGRIAGRLTELSVRSVRRPALLVKTIGDAAMFVSPDPGVLVDVCLRLIGCIQAEGEEFPAVRVGMAFGPATTRGGDWFGAPVNLASRVTGVAKPGTLYATEEVQRRTEDRSWDRKRKRGLRGVDGRVRLFELEPG
jgi:adenylate cyclase